MAGVQSSQHFCITHHKGSHPFSVHQIFHFRRDKVIFGFSDLWLERSCPRRKCLTWLHPECCVARFILGNAATALLCRDSSCPLGSVGHELFFLSSRTTRAWSLLCSALPGGWRWTPLTQQCHRAHSRDFLSLLLGLP